MAKAVVPESKYSNTHLLGVCYGYPGWILRTSKGSGTTEEFIQKWEGSHPEGVHGPSVYLKWTDKDAIEIREVKNGQFTTNVLALLIPGEVRKTRDYGLQSEPATTDNPPSGTGEAILETPQPDPGDETPPRRKQPVRRSVGRGPGAGGRRRSA